jgi:hypothetical protein
VLFDRHMTERAIRERHDAGARIKIRPLEASEASSEMLFLVRTDGQLVPFLQDGMPSSKPGDVVVCLDSSGAQRCHDR